jgi:hypothetical protein
LDTGFVPVPGVIVSVRPVAGLVVTVVPGVVVGALGPGVVVVPGVVVGALGPGAGLDSAAGTVSRGGNGSAAIGD